MRPTRKLKIGVTVGLLILLGAGMAAFAIRALSDADSRMTELVETEVPPVVYAERLREAGIAISEAQKAAILADDPETLAGIEARPDGLIAEKERLIERLRAFEDAEGRRLLSEVSDGVDRYLETGDRILAETGRNSDRRALELSRGPGAEALSAMRAH